MKAFVIVLFFVVASVAVPILSSTAAAQADFDRDACLRKCAWHKPFGTNYGQWMNYEKCISDCERRSWNGVDDKTKDLERERDQE